MTPLERAAEAARVAINKRGATPETIAQAVMEALFPEAPEPERMEVMARAHSQRIWGKIDKMDVKSLGCYRQDIIYEQLNLMRSAYNAERKWIFSDG